jgi:hypothetical protein
LTLTDDPENAKGAATKRSRWGELAINLGLSLATLCLVLLFCEFVMFRFVWVASDAPVNDFIGGVVRYAPNQHGVWRVRDEIAAPYRVNAEGWNSGVGDYAIGRQPGVSRIAIVGDSYVEALQVAYDRSLGERLASDLRSDAARTEVYRFAISGAPLSQDLQVIDREVLRYRPDCIVVVMTNLDFDNSYKFQPGRYTSSFLKLKVEAGRVVGEIPPIPWKSDWREWLRTTATARYFLYRWRVRPQRLIDLVLPHAEARSIELPPDLAAALPDAADTAAATDYLFARIAEAARSIDARLLLVMFGNSAAIYQGLDGSQAPLSRLAAMVAAQRNLPFIDLDTTFAANWRAEHQRFDFNADGHWNEHGHEVAAHAIADALRTAGWR